MITPLNDDETLDEQGLSRVVEHVIAGGVSGIFVLGTSGEYPTLHDSVKTRAVELVCQQASGRVQVLAGAIEPSTRRVIAAARLYARLGVDAVVITASYYYNYGQAELAAHCRMIARAVDAPLVLYDNPDVLHHRLEPDTVEALADEPGIVGLKDSTGDMTKFQRHLDRRQDGFSICQGAEEVAAVGVARGADGLVLGMANPAPRLCVDLYEAAASGDLPRAWSLQQKLSQLRTLQNNGPWLSCLKMAMHHLGLCGPTVAAPFARLGEQQAEAVRQTLIDVGLLN
jgi:4-hydroxy-tetrahydrodipicolinate synthase